MGACLQEELLDFPSSAPFYRAVKVFACCSQVDLTVKDHFQILRQSLLHLGKLGGHELKILRSCWLTATPMQDWGDCSKTCGRGPTAVHHISFHRAFCRERLQAIE
jgi:hypothetical protein